VIDAFLASCLQGSPYSVGWSFHGDGDGDNEYTNLSFFSASCCFLFIYSSLSIFHLLAFLISLYPFFNNSLSMWSLHGNNVSIALNFGDHQTNTLSTYIPIPATTPSESVPLGLDIDAVYPLVVNEGDTITILSFNDNTHFLEYTAHNMSCVFTTSTADDSESISSTSVAILNNNSTLTCTVPSDLCNGENSADFNQVTLVQVSLLETTHGHTSDSLLLRVLPEEQSAEVARLTRELYIHDGYNISQSVYR
jgi:hypothetical protein